MARGSKTSYSSKQKRKARHIEESYEQRGISVKTAARRAWATVNKEDGGGRKRRAPKARPRGAKKTSSRRSRRSGAQR
ncbi:MAG: plasmid stabilization protein [Planctomycetota bacterium]